jgi:hypothetical protein
MSKENSDQSRLPFQSEFGISPEKPVIPDTTIRYHHLDNWLALVEDWLNIPALYSFFTKSVPTPSRVKPWEEADKASVNQELRLFCYQQALDKTQYHLSKYQGDHLFLNKLAEILTLLTETKANNPENETMVADFYQLCLALGLKFKHWGALHTIDHQQEFFQALLSYDTQPDQFDDFCRQMLAKLTHSVDECNLEEQRGKIPPEDLHLLHSLRHSAQVLPSLIEKFRTIFASPTQDPLRSLTTHLIYFVNPKTRSILEWEEFMTAMSSDQDFDHHLTKLSQDLQRGLHYIEDLFGPQPSLDSVVTKAALNKTFLTYYQFFRTALYQPDRQVIFTGEIDLMCKACRGGETEVGEHCLKEQDALTKQFGADAATRDTLVKFFSDPNLPASIRDQVKISRDSTNQVTEIRMPIKFYFDVELMFNFQKLYRKVSSEYYAKLPL